MGGLGEQGRQDKDGFDDEGPAVSRLTNVALRERAYTELANALRAGRFSPGSPVTIRGLAALLGTSTMPVREAVSRLVTEGALELLSNRTLRVPDVSMERLDDLIDTRATLEGRAAWLAAERMTQADFSLIKAAAEDYSHAVDAGDVPAAVAANEQLHFTIYRASRSELLVSIIEMLWLQSGPYIAAVMKQMQSTREILHDRGIMHHSIFWPRLQSAIRKHPATRCSPISSMRPSGTRRRSSLRTVRRSWCRPQSESAGAGPRRRPTNTLATPTGHGERQWLANPRGS